MSRFLTTIPSNTGFVNLGLVETYPTGGGGPTAYGPTSYYGSDPRPAEDGDNLNNPIDLGDFSSIFKSFVIKNTHGGLSRKQTTFYKIKLSRPRTVQFTQNFSQFSYEENTNRNNGALLTDFPKTTLEEGNYLFLITNDIRYLETNYSINLNVSVLDWRFVTEGITESLNFGDVDANVESTLDFGSIS